MSSRSARGDNKTPMSLPGMETVFRTSIADDAESARRALSLRGIDAQVLTAQTPDGKVLSEVVVPADRSDQARAIVRAGLSSRLT